MPCLAHCPPLPALPIQPYRISGQGLSKGPSFSSPVAAKQDPIQRAGQAYSTLRHFYTEVHIVPTIFHFPTLAPAGSSSHSTGLGLGPPPPFRFHPRHSIGLCISCPRLSCSLLLWATKCLSSALSPTIYLKWTFHCWTDATTETSKGHLAWLFRLPCLTFLFISSSQSKTFWSLLF